MSNLRHLAKRDLIVSPERFPGATKWASRFSGLANLRDEIRDRRTYSVRCEGLIDSIVDQVDGLSASDLLPRLKRSVPMYDRMWLEAGTTAYLVGHEMVANGHKVSVVAFKALEGWTGIVPIGIGGYQVDDAGEYVSGSALIAPLHTDLVDAGPGVILASVALCCSAMHRHCENGGLQFWREIKAPKGMTPFTAPASVWREITLRDSIDQHTGQALRSDDPAERNPVRLHIVRGYWRNTPTRRWVNSYERGDFRRGEVVKEFTIQGVA